MLNVTPMKKAPGQESLLIDGDEQVLGHAVDKAEGQEQIMIRRAIIESGRLFGTAQHHNEALGDKWRPRCNGQGDDEQQPQREHIGPHERVAAESA